MNVKHVPQNLANLLQTHSHVYISMLKQIQCWEMNFVWFMVVDIFIWAFVCRGKPGVSCQNTELQSTTPNKSNNTIHKSNCVIFIVLCNCGVSEKRSKSWAIRYLTYIGCGDECVHTCILADYATSTGIGFEPFLLSSSQSIDKSSLHSLSVLSHGRAASPVVFE